MMLYKHFFKPILFHFDPESVHNLFTTVGEWAGKYAVTRALVSAVYGYNGKDISRTVDGITYRTPLILSAGFDYNARLTQILSSISFGGVEVGSVTARPCEGNPKPRLTRLIKSRSILVNKGLRNEGVNAIIARLARTPRVPGLVIGVSIARTNDEEASSVEGGIHDYVYSYQRLNETNTGDYYTINISCPNAFCGETFATPELLRRLLGALRQVPSKKPLYLKLPIVLSWEELDRLIAIGIEHHISGIIIGNLQKDYAVLTHREEAPEGYRGGLSGLPTQARSTELIKLAHAKYGSQITIMGCGGILSPEDALVKLSSGAVLLQMITGVIFEGPGLLKRIASAIAGETAHPVSH
ncbi:MAG: quinone-dependent dihydroorotate dehydrogenase [Candidatus Paceibacterota bacterium]|jgi:dihydroorotate dehydrogenase subfamily 2